MRKEKSAAAAFVEWAERVEWVEVVLRDGRVLEGNVVRNPIRQTGTVVNAIAETRQDFMLDDVVSVKRVEDPRRLHRYHEAAQPLELLFDEADFSEAAIAELILVLSGLYRSLGGDRLVLNEPKGVASGSGSLQPVG